MRHLREDEAAKEATDLADRLAGLLYASNCDVQTALAALTYTTAQIIYGCGLATHPTAIDEAADVAIEGLKAAIRGFVQYGPTTAGPLH